MAEIPYVYMMCGMEYKPKLGLSGYWYGGGWAHTGGYGAVFGRELDYVDKRCIYVAELGLGTFHWDTEYYG